MQSNARSTIHATRWEEIKLRHMLLSIVNYLR